KNYFFLEENLENFSTELNKINDTFVNLNDILLVREEYEALNDEIKKIVIKYSGLEKKDRLMDTFKKLYWSKVLENILKKGNIIPPKDLVEKYRLNAFEVSDNWRFKIMGAANMKKPSLAITSSGSSEVSILRREGKKKRRLKPIRDLLSETSDLSFSLKPCFMMSPLSVSQYIDPNKIKFDVVIFDEASQIMPQDAVPCLMRSKQAIIMGDTQQLPPTTFFSSQDEEEVEEEIEDLESFLSEASIKFREKSLDWHYRSNDESLIAFSNHFFYDGRLITFPNSSNSNGLEHIYVKEGVYDRGKSRKNRKEAKAIVESYVSLKKKYPTKSFGIIAFSIAQENAIREEFQLKKIDLDASIGSEKEDLFVKNLETVQGDERDIIIISVGYGKSSDGKLSYNFGPINKEGGFKRLNVAITRSRFKTLIFSSILPTMLDEDKINSQGLRNLKQYMTYARKKNIGGLISSTEHLNFDSGFEESVYDSLINEGYDVSCQVGCSGYKVDLAIKHPKNKGEYILGVECDGAQYHSSRYARDRDKVRQDVLERLGWKIHRIWSDDWLNNREHELEKIKNKINSLLKSKKKFEKKQDNQFLDADEEHLEEKEIEDLFESYEFADIPTRRRKLEYDSYGDLYDEEYIKRLIREVLSIEEPIEKSLLYKRVANSFGIRKVGARIKRNFDGLINEMGIQKNGETLSWKRITGIFPPRISNEEVRPFIYIPKEELAGALIEILKNNFSTDRKSIMKDVTKIYNINRLGNKVHKKVEEAIKYLKRKKLIEEFDGKIRKTKEK
ncbi:DUF3320 domain-containing protein, partial [Candidatus Woesearchaeota archaeon]|nr:DUF3320 domain-containing protein [Candidatus Woesearchaeota archaeon]